MAQIQTIADASDVVTHFIICLADSLLAQSSQLLHKGQSRVTVVLCRALMERGGILLLRNGGTVNLQHPGTDAGLGVLRHHGLLAAAQGDGTPGAGALQTAALGAPSSALPVGDEIDDLIQTALVVGAQLPLINHQRDVAKQAGGALKTDARSVEVNHQALRVAPDGGRSLEGRRLAAPAVTPVVHDKISLSDDAQQSRREADSHDEAKSVAASEGQHDVHPLLQTPTLRKRLGNLPGNQVRVRDDRPARAGEEEILTLPPEAARQLGFGDALRVRGLQTG